MVNPFETLGLPLKFGLTQSEIEKQFRELQRKFHPDKFSQSSAMERRLALSKAVEINEAYRVLRDDISRATALLVALGYVAQKESANADPAFLMEVMELREELAEARAAGNTAKMSAMEKNVRALSAAITMKISSSLDGATHDVVALAAVEKDLHRLRYYRRFMDELTAIEDERDARA